jgi:hypothetical protein
MSMSYPAGSRYVTPIPDAAMQAAAEELERITAAPDLESERISGETSEGFVVRAILTAARPHLVDDKVVEHAAMALWAEGHRTPSPPHPNVAYWKRIARRALEAALGAPVKAGAVDDDE